MIEVLRNFTFIKNYYYFILKVILNVYIYKHICIYIYISLCFMFSGKLSIKIKSEINSIYNSNNL